MASPLPSTGHPATCDLVVRNGLVVTMDAEDRIIPDGAVAIKGRDIVAVDTTAAIDAAFRPARTLDAKGAIVHPGMIDGHYHAGLHLSRGAITDNPNPPPDEGGAGPGVFIRWINALDEASEYASALLATVELVKNGFTGYVDAATSFFPDAVGAAAEAVGIRVSVSDCSLWDIVGGDPMAALITNAPCDAERCRELVGNEAKKRSNSDGLVTGHVAVYGCGSASEELMLEARRLSLELGAPYHQHQNFMPADAGYDRERFGKPALVHYAEIGLLGPETVFTHMNVLDDAEVEALAESGTGLVWHPGNFMYYSISQMAKSRFPELYRAGNPIAFGTDVAKAWAFGELGFIAYLVSREWGDYLPAYALLDMFTRGGAHAIGNKKLGALAPGYRADVVIRSEDMPDAQPNVDPIRQLMLVSRTKSVDTVVCNGEIVLRGGRLTRLDEGAVYALARAETERVADIAGIRLGIQPVQKTARRAS